MRRNIAISLLGLLLIVAVGLSLGCMWQKKKVAVEAASDIIAAPQPHPSAPLEAEVPQSAPLERMAPAASSPASANAYTIGASPASASPATPNYPTASQAAPNDESYSQVDENAFLEVEDKPLSTFSIDVDTASYANVRRFLTSGQLPPKDAVRVEELINNFSYHDLAPSNGDPFAVHTEVAGCPWNEEHKLLRIGIKGKEISLKKRPASNLVFLLDCSGSMADENKLPLIKRAIRLLTQKLDERDRVAIVTYAAESSLVLPSTACTDQNRVAILQAVENLSAGGSTQGSAGITQAYQVAGENFIKGGTNRVILASDGDFNVGITDQGELTKLITDKAKSGIFLSVFGFGLGNLKDATLEKLADKGNGHYGYIDTISEARKKLVEEMSATLITIAKDVKVQVEFNPARVGSYRLIGYENRLLRDKDFKDDKKDAGEIGAGHTVTVLYELVPAGQSADEPQVDPLKYKAKHKHKRQTPKSDFSDELLTVKLRYKKPEGSTSRQMTVVVKDGKENLEQSSRDFRFASAVAAFGMLLRGSEFKGEASYDQVIKLALASKGEDEDGYRAEFINLARNARELSAK